MWILTPPWLLFSLRGWRKRCQHDPGSRLWRGSGGKSKTLSISSPHIDVPLSQIFALCFLSRSLLRSETCTHRWFLFMRIYCLSRGNKDDRMLFFFSFFLIKQKSLISHRSVKSLSRWTVCTDKDLKHVSAMILLAESFRLLGKLSFSLSWWKLVERITTTLSLA